VARKKQLSRKQRITDIAPGHSYNIQYLQLAFDGSFIKPCIKNIDAMKIRSLQENSLHVRKKMQVKMNK